MSTEIGFYLQQLREEQGLGVREAARLLEISPSTVSRLEHGERYPSLSMLWEIVTGLEGDYNYALVLLSKDAIAASGISASTHAQ